jgi:hypothetical protein
VTGKKVGNPEPLPAQAAVENPVQQWCDVDIQALNELLNKEIAHLIYINDSGVSSLNTEGLEKLRKKLGYLGSTLTWTKAKIDGLLADAKLLKVDGTGKYTYHLGSIKLVIEVKRQKQFVSHTSAQMANLRRFDVADAKEAEAAASEDDEEDEDDDFDVPDDEVDKSWGQLSLSSSARTCVGQCARDSWSNC